jgi:alpha-L-fucosidase 2
LRQTDRTFFTIFLSGDAMIRTLPIVKYLLSFFFLTTIAAMASENRFVSANDVTWTDLGHNENDSMPIGNGDLAANVWTEQNGDLVLLVAKADAWTELGKLVKLGRVRIQLTPNPFAGAADFKQALRLEDGSIVISERSQCRDGLDRCESTGDSC